MQTDLIQSVENISTTRCYICLQFKEYVKSTDCKRSVNKHSISRPVGYYHHQLSSVIMTHLYTCIAHSLIAHSGSDVPLPGCSE